MRGAFNSFMSLTQEQKTKGLVTVSDGNFAEAFAFFCNYFKIKGRQIIIEYRNCIFARSVLLMENRNNLKIWEGLY